MDVDEKKSDGEMAYADIHKYIGEMGFYQWRMFAVVCLFTLYGGDVMHMVFIGGDMDHW